MWERVWLTDAGGDGGTALLVAFGTAVAGDASDAIFAGALARGLVARLASSTHRVAVTGWGGGRGSRCEGREEEREFVEYQYFKSGTVKTADSFVRMLNLAVLAWWHRYAVPSLPKPLVSVKPTPRATSSARVTLFL